MNAITPFTPAVPNFTMSDMEKVANAIARGGLFGSKDPFAVLTLCMVAQAEGQHPAVVFRDYHLISGKPSKKAEAMQRDFLAAGGKIEWHELTDECCSATFSHPQGGSARIDWDKARVKQAQLGSNAMHAKYPRQMLRSRVISEGVRTVFPGATSGMYVPEEVADFGPASPTPAAPAPTRARQIEAKRPPETPTGTTSDAASGAASPTAAEKAATWLAEFEAKVAAADGREALSAVQQAAARALVKLGDQHPDLRDRALEAVRERLEAFEAGDDEVADADGVFADDQA